MVIECMASRFPKPVAGDELGKRRRQKSAPNLKTRSGSLVSRVRAGVPTEQPSGSFVGASCESASSCLWQPAGSVSKTASDRAKTVSIITRKGQHVAAVSRKFSLGAAVISKDVTAGLFVPSERVSVTTSLNKTVSDTAGMLESRRNRRASDASAIAQGSRPLGLGHAQGSTGPNTSRPPAQSLALDSTRAFRPRRSTVSDMASSGTLSVVANSPGKVKQGPSAPACRPGTVRSCKPGANVFPQIEASSKHGNMSGWIRMLPASKTSVTIGTRHIRSTVPRPSRRSSCVETKAPSACLQPRCMPTSYRHHNKDISSNVEEGFPVPQAQNGFSGCTDQISANLESNNCAFEVQSLFGIKKSRHSIHACYKIGRIIGDGNFAVVRECQNRKTQKSYALKIISKSKVKGKEHMIENEILILRRIRHRNVVELIEEFETPKEIFLVMELVEGGDLFDAIVANTRFPEDDSAHMIRDLASAVDYLHSLSIVHRDIKPENLLVVNKPDGSKALKLADFGLSMEVKSVMFLVCGTPTYVAPEILEECGYGLKVDIWAIGVICYILLCGFPPFRSSNHDQEELFDKILRGDYEYLAPFWDDICDDPRDLIDHLLVVDVNRRYDAKEILQHFWIEKWTRPSAKIHRELSEEANLHNRKRLRGVALAIQSVIGLLFAVREKNAFKSLLALSPLHAFVSTSGPGPEPVARKWIAGLSRIPRPRYAPGFVVAEIRKAVTTPIRGVHPGTRPMFASQRLSTIHTKFAPKGILIRDEAIRREKIISRPSVYTELPLWPRRRISFRKSNSINSTALTGNLFSSTPTRHVTVRPRSGVELREDHFLAHALRANETPRSLITVASCRHLTSLYKRVAPTVSGTRRSSHVGIVANDFVSRGKLIDLSDDKIMDARNRSDKVARKCHVRPERSMKPYDKSSRQAAYSSARSLVASEVLHIPEQARQNLSRHMNSARQRSKSLSLQPVFGQSNLNADVFLPDNGAIRAVLLAELQQRDRYREPCSSQALRKIDHAAASRSFLANAIDTNSLLVELAGTERKSCTASAASQMLVLQDFPTVTTGSSAESPTMLSHASPPKTYAALRKTSVAAQSTLRRPLPQTSVRRASSVEPATYRRWNSAQIPGKKHGPSSHQYLSGETFSNSRCLLERGSALGSKMARNRAKPRDCSDIKIVTETEKRRNVKFPNGSTVDKEAKTKTRVSVSHSSAADKALTDFTGSLLKQMRKLTPDIANLPQAEQELPAPSDSSIESFLGDQSLPSRAPVLCRAPKGHCTEPENLEAAVEISSCSDSLSGHTDCFRDTEYLSLSHAAP